MNEFTPGEFIPETPIEQPPEDRWAARGRSPVAAAVIALIAVGGVYFAAQILFTIIGLLVSVQDLGALMSLRDAPSAETFDMIVNPLRWAVMLSQYLALLLPAAILVRAWHARRVTAYVRMRAASPVEILLAMTGTLCIIPIGAMITNLVSGGAQESSELEKLTERLFTAHSPAEFAFLVFVVAVTPAICEEFFFRGYVQRTFERRIGAHSVPLVGVIFALFHMQPAGLLSLSFIGMWLGFVYYRSRSLLPNMAAHFTNNFVALWLVYQAPVLFGANLKDDGDFPIWVGLGAIPLLALVMWGYLAATRNRESGAVQSA